MLTGTTPKNNTQFDPNQQDRDFKKKVTAVLRMSIVNFRGFNIDLYCPAETSKRTKIQFWTRRAKHVIFGWKI